ncbi:MAG: hypothetical protein MZV64_23050 [Ignavibacteriales bacterium]|nr:hypothetical protein [Ignavibacteriales bacterium]
MRRYNYCVGGLSHGVQSHLHKGRVAARAFAPFTGATFVYDGDGRRQAQTINGVTTYFIGAHYELTGSQVTKYYFAGTTRIATPALAPGASVRKYTIPQNMTVEYFLGGPSGKHEHHDRRQRGEGL